MGERTTTTTTTTAKITMTTSRRRRRPRRRWRRKRKGGNGECDHEVDTKRSKWPIARVPLLWRLEHKRNFAQSDGAHARTWRPKGQHCVREHFEAKIREVKMNRGIWEEQRKTNSTASTTATAMAPQGKHQIFLETQDRKQASWSQSSPLESQDHIRASVFLFAFLF